MRAQSDFIDDVKRASPNRSVLHVGVEIVLALLLRLRLRLLSWEIQAMLVPDVSAVIASDCVGELIDLLVAHSAEHNVLKRLIEQHHAGVGRWCLFPTSVLDGVISKKDRHVLVHPVGRGCVFAIWMALDAGEVSLIVLRQLEGRGVSRVEGGKEGRRDAAVGLGSIAGPALVAEVRVFKFLGSVVLRGIAAFEVKCVRAAVAADEQAWLAAGLALVMVRVLCCC